MTAPRVLFLIGLLGCSAPPRPNNKEQILCSLDSDCGPGRYCTDVGVCRLDCVVDEHCFGPGEGWQCNSLGRCIQTIDAMTPPDALDDTTLSGDTTPSGETAPVSDSAREGG